MEDKKFLVYVDTSCIQSSLYRLEAVFDTKQEASRYVRVQAIDNPCNDYEIYHQDECEGLIQADMDTFIPFVGEYVDLPLPDEVFTFIQSLGGIFRDMHEFVSTVIIDYIFELNIKAIKCISYDCGFDDNVSVYHQYKLRICDDILKFAKTEMQNFDYSEEEFNTFLYHAFLNYMKKIEVLEFDVNSFVKKLTAVRTAESED